MRSRARRGSPISVPPPVTAQASCGHGWQEMRWQVNADPERWLAELDTLVKEARPAIEQDGDAAALAALEHAAGYVDYNRGRQAAALAAFTRGMQPRPASG